MTLEEAIASLRKIEEIIPSYCRSQAFDVVIKGVEKLQADIEKLRILAFVRCPLHQKSGLRYDDMYFNGKCEGYCRGTEDDEPLEVCQKCELQTYYDESEGVK